MNSDRSNIIVAMQAIRQRQSVKLAQLEEESQRLTDWREYVRSAPLTTLAGSVVIGALTGSYLGSIPNDSATVGNISANHRADPIVRSSFLSNAMGFIMPIVTSAARQHIAMAMTTLVERITKPRSDERDSAE